MSDEWDEVSDEEASYDSECALLCEVKDLRAQLAACQARRDAVAEALEELLDAVPYGDAWDAERRKARQVLATPASPAGEKQA